MRVYVLSLCLLGKSAIFHNWVFDLTMDLKGNMLKKIDVPELCY
jgi:hypothetical protein